MRGIREGILKVEQSIQNLMKWVLSLVTGAMTLVVLLGVFFRYFLKAPLPWSEELARYLMVWGASLGAFVAFREGSHVGVTMLMDRLHGQTAIVLTKAAQFIVILFMATVMIEGFVLVSKIKGQTSAAMEIPMGWAYIAIPVGCLLILMEALIMIFFKGDQSPEKGVKSL
jgi:TRAP-type C4-dicarboxylate transport system permease small subunit